MEKTLFLTSATNVRQLNTLGGAPFNAWSGAASTTAYPSDLTVANVDSNAMIVNINMTMGGTTDMPQAHHMILTLYP